MTTFNIHEKRVLASLAGIFSLRMLGLFMIFPVFSLYANQLTHSTPLLVGIALGIYGLTQGALQIPFGFFSDKIGRKPILFLGLALFMFGSFICAWADSIYQIILGRLLQGSGAVGSVIMALLCDLTRIEVRVRAMAVIGITIGLSFSLSLFLGPLMNVAIGTKGIFLLMAFLSLCAMGVLFFFVPGSYRKKSNDLIPVLADIPKVFFMRELLLLNVGVFILHASLVAIFLKIPIELKNTGFLEGKESQFYLPVFLCALLSTIPCLKMIEQRKQVGFLLSVMISLLAFSELGLLYFRLKPMGLAFSLWVFFTAFNTLEAGLPSLVSQFAESRFKGTALGIYSTFQFLGLFLGGVLGGWLDLKLGTPGVLLFCVILAMVWLGVFYSQIRRGLRWQEG